MMESHVSSLLREKNVSGLKGEREGTGPLTMSRRLFLNSFIHNSLMTCFGSKNSYFQTWKFSGPPAQIARGRDLVEKAKETTGLVSPFGSKSQESA